MLRYHHVGSMWALWRLGRRADRSCGYGISKLLDGESAIEFDVFRYLTRRGMLY
jgi:hypothetical protein